MPTERPPELGPLLDRVRALAPLVEAEAPESERARTLTPRTVEAMTETGILCASLPRELGGCELPAAALVELYEEVARQDGSTGWCFGMNGVVTGITAASLPDAGCKTVFEARPPGHTLLAGGFPPQGRAERVGDDWRVSGHFGFGSGCRHAHYLVCTCVEFEGGAPRVEAAGPAMRSFVLAPEQVSIEDNWHATGLEGTGSCDYRLEATRVPDELSFPSGIRLAPQRGHSLFSLPLLSLAGAPHAGFALGTGRRALEEIAAHATWRQRLGSASRLAERASFQQGFGRARTQLQAARSLVLQSLEALHHHLETDGSVPLSARADAASATTNAYEQATAAATFAFRAGGGAAVYRGVRLQRCFRDIQTGSQHIVVSDESFERAAQVWLGVGEPQML